MLCSKCNAEMPVNALYCPFCGRAVNYTPQRKKRGNGQGTAIKRGKTWTAVATIANYWDGKKRIQKRATKGGFATKKEALAYVPMLLSEKQGINAVDQEMTLKELYEMWEKQHENDVVKSTMNCYKAAWKYYESIQYYKVYNVKTASMQECIDNCGKGKRTQENMKALGTMLFRMAMSNDLADKNYAEGLVPRGEKQEPRKPFTKEEQKKMWSVVNKPDYDYKTNHMDLILILCYTGFRLDEFLELKDTDFHETKEWAYFVGGEKTEAGIDRIVGISPKILPLVKRHLKPGYIFSEKGKKLSQRKFRKDYYYPPLEAAGIEKKVPHCCRHTFATLMKDVKISDTDKAAMIGHSKISQTMEYTHSDLDNLIILTNSL